MRRRSIKRTRKVREVASGEYGARGVERKLQAGVGYESGGHVLVGCVKKRKIRWIKDDTGSLRSDRQNAISWYVEIIAATGAYDLAIVRAYCETAPAENVRVDGPLSGLPKNKVLIHLIGSNIRILVNAYGACKTGWYKQCVVS